MKRILLLSAICLLAASMANAQSLKERLKSTKEQLTGSTGSEESLEISNEMTDQYGEFEKFRSGERIYKITQRVSGSFYHDKFNGEFEEKNKFMSKVTEGEKVAAFSYRVMDFSLDNASFPLYFTNKSQSDMLVFINGTVYHVSGLKNDGSFGKLVSVHTIDKSVVKACAKWPEDQAKKDIANYFNEVKANYDAALNAEAENKAKAQAADRERFTITNKGVTSIKLQMSDAVEQGESYRIVVTALLEDGSTISTNDGGFIDEYTIAVSGLPASYNDPSSITGQRPTVGLSSINIPDVTIVKGDKIEITVTAKHNPVLKASKTVVLDYSKSVDLDYNAEMRSDQVSVQGGDLRVELKQVKHAVSGIALLEYKVWNGKGDLLKHFRIEPSAYVNISVNGQKGWKAISGTKPPMNGTKGGDVTVIIDPSVKSYNLNVSNSGGRGGEGGYGYPAGSDGADGSVKKLEQKVNW